MIISKTQINSVAEELHTLMARKENLLKATIETFNSWNEIASLLKGLLAHMTRAKSLILSDEKELKELKARWEELSRLRQADANDPCSEKCAVSLVEIQAILGSTAPSLTASLVAAIQSNLKKLRQVLDDGVVADSNSGKKNMPIQAKKISHENILEHLSTDSKGRNFNKTKEAHNEPLNKTVISKVHKQPRVLSECKRHFGHHILLKNGTHPKGVPKNRKSNAHRFSSERTSPMKKVLLKPSELKKKNVKELVNRTDIADKSLLNNQVNFKVESTRNAEMKKAFSLTDFKFNSKPVMEALNILAEESKTCSVCNEVTSGVVLKCCGKICIQCIRKRLMGNNPQILLNAFESERKQDGMCTCPIHKVTIKVDLLQKIFSSVELERLSVEALRRERKSIRRTIKSPIICADCKKIISDDSKSIRVCLLHKVCSSCFM
eukprot:TRINITY_DN9488_c0_g1_i2.p2 TRINITY_DN9488_c0_g1~~TRINITY_DN9488_c0_g1_i2.p2  ORF type:complete len:436 (+),score=53.06 TRINITY_DN9488_c0_g1_i2:225-1532(+)